jgi:hypothetical protein
MNKNILFRKHLADVYLSKYAHGFVTQRFAGRLSELTPDVMRDELNLFAESMMQNKNYAMFINEIVRLSVDSHGLHEKEKLMYISSKIIKSDNNLLRSVFGASMFLPMFAPLNAQNDMVLSAASKALTFDSHVFHCSDVVREMLIVTDNDIHFRKLPFRSIFIDTNLKYDNVTFFGLLLMHSHAVGNNVSSICIDESCKDGAESFMLVAIGLDESDNELVFHYCDVTDSSLELKDNAQLRFLAEFACNFLDFLHDPNVEYVKANESFGAAHRHLRKLYDSRKLDMEKIHFIRVNDSLRRYIDKCAHMQSKRGFSFRFWVRGHFRTLRADRYGENVGKRLWIVPYIKGQGVLIEKKYELEKRDGVSR